MYVRIFDRKEQDIVEYPAWRLGELLRFVWAFRRDWRSWFFRLVWY